MRVCVCCVCCACPVYYGTSVSRGAWYVWYIHDGSVCDNCVRVVSPARASPQGGLLQACAADRSEAGTLAFVPSGPPETICYTPTFCRLLTKPGLL